jgi:hypothetical protein
VEEALDHCQFVGNGILKLRVTGRGFQHRVHEHAAALQLIANAPLTAKSRPNRQDFVSRIQTRTAMVVSGTMTWVPLPSRAATKRFAFGSRIGNEP